MCSAPRQVPVSELLLGACPRCDGVGCKECALEDHYGWTAPFVVDENRYATDDRRFVDCVDDPFGPPGDDVPFDEVEDEDADESFGARLARGFALLAEGDDSIGED